MQAEIKEIFESIQGEGLFAGDKQIFIRFTKCNLACKYCDTEFHADRESRVLNEQELFDILKKYNSNTIMLTGGEPLIEAEFISSFLSKYKKFLNKKIILETSGTLVYNLKKTIEHIDIVSADIKLESATGQDNKFDINDKFFEIAKRKKVYCKVVFDENIKDIEIYNVIKLAQKYDLIIVLQPKMPMDGNIPLLDIYNRFYNNYKKVKLLPQIHKFLYLR